jgi:hypothetical protein
LTAPAFRPQSRLRAGQQECRRYNIQRMGKMGQTANSTNPKIVFLAKKPRAESIAPSSRFPSVFSGSPVLPASAFRTFVIRIVQFSTIRAFPSILSGSVLLFHHDILHCLQCLFGE